MNKRAKLQPVLDSEVARWQKMPCDQIICELRDTRAYQVEANAEQFQVEVELVENTTEYLHVVVSVDDGSFPYSIVPATSSFITRKDKTA